MDAKVYDNIDMKLFKNSNFPKLARIDKKNRNIGTKTTSSSSVKQTTSQQVNPQSPQATPQISTSSNTSRSSRIRSTSRSSSSTQASQSSSSSTLVPQNTSTSNQQSPSSPNQQNPSPQNTSPLITNSNTPPIQQTPEPPKNVSLPNTPPPIMIVEEKTPVAIVVEGNIKVVNKTTIDLILTVNNNETLIKASTNFPDLLIPENQSTNIKFRAATSAGKNDFTIAINPSTLASREIIIEECNTEAIRKVSTDQLSLATEMNINAIQRTNPVYQIIVKSSGRVLSPRVTIPITVKVTNQTDVPFTISLAGQTTSVTVPAGRSNSCYTNYPTSIKITPPQGYKYKEWPTFGGTIFIQKVLMTSNNALCDIVIKKGPNYSDTKKEIKLTINGVVVNKFTDLLDQIPNDTGYFTLIK